MKGDEDYIKFLGTAGARFVVSKQLRASGGIWLHLDGRNILIDPGPGALVKLSSSRPRLDPTRLDAVIATHRHMDHTNDLSCVVEAMTEGGMKNRGEVYLPSDALGKEPVLFSYVSDAVSNIFTLKEGRSYKVAGSISMKTPLKHRHGVETYGLLFEHEGRRIAFISDTEFFDKIADVYQSDVAVINVVLFEPKKTPNGTPIQHLCLSDCKRIIMGIKPRIAILTHFGMTMLKKRPFEIAGRIKQDTGVETIAASDGMKFDLNRVL
jgi:phosphoribosyl 1,2-cyclic phosphodiesterase